MKSRNPYSTTTENGFIHRSNQSLSWPLLRCSCHCVTTITGGQNSNRHPRKTNSSRQQLLAMKWTGEETKKLLDQVQPRFANVVGFDYVFTLHWIRTLGISSETSNECETRAPCAEFRKLLSHNDAQVRGRKVQQQQTYKLTTTC